MKQTRYFSFAYSSLTVGEEMFWDMLRKTNRVFCRFKSISAYDVLDVAALANVTDDFVDDVFACISRIWLV